MLGPLHKMRVEASDPVSYFLPLGDVTVPLTPLLGKEIHFRYQGIILCQACNRKTPKSYNQGYCFPCFRKLAACDMCILKPETCHFHLGTCREPEWGQTHCMIPHIVYLANSSGIKVGITRETQIPVRWMDQGASQALPVFRVASRYLSGLVETLFAQHIADKTNWQALLKSDSDPVDLAQARDDLVRVCRAELDELAVRFPGQIAYLDGEAESTFRYPVLEYPAKVTAFNLDKHPDVRGTIIGIKGQYLLLDSGVINIRKFTSYQVEWLPV
ncbi:MAG: DUF2797 domain-containing protein [Gammaproteobacteria bacterium]